MLHIETSWDDGHQLDLKIAELLRDYKLPGTFYISKHSVAFPRDERLTDDQIIELAKDFKIGSHTVTHPEDLKKISDEQLDFELGASREWLRTMTKQDIFDFCYPRGRYNEREVEMLKKLGYKSARTTVVLNTDCPDDDFRIKTTIHAHPNRQEYEGKDWLVLAKEKVDEAVKKGNKGYFHLWGHSWEVQEFNLWKQIEELLNYINTQKRICESDEECEACQ